LEFNNRVAIFCLALIVILVVAFAVGQFDCRHNVDLYEMLCR